MLIKLFILLLIPLFLSLLFTPGAKSLARFCGAMDIPDERKIHSKSTPRLGGVAIFGSFLLALVLLFYSFPDLFLTVVSESPDSFVNQTQGILILVSFFLIIVLGTWDDIKTLDPGPKFAIQFIAATLIYFAGFKISFVTNPTGPGVLNLDLLSYPLTALWIVGITNAFNLIDGLDGLASGVAAIALITIVGISIVHQQTGIAIVAIILAGAILGFLWYNFRPATIFLGDSGSLFIGFFLALLSIQSYTKVSTTFAALIPVFALGLPILDTSLSMFRRLFSWFLPEDEDIQEKATFKKITKSIFTPDKSHIHHQLINRGLSHKNTVLVLYTVSALFCLGAFLVSVTDQIDTTILIILFALVTIKMGVDRLSYDEINLLQNGIFLTLYNYLIINKRYFRKVLDGLFILAAYFGSYYLLYPTDFNTFVATQPFEGLFIAFSILGVQMAIFWLAGLYKKTIRQLGIADVVKILQMVLFAVIATAITHHTFFSNYLNSSLLLFVINFYLLLTLVLGMRASFHVLKYLFNKSRKDQQRILVYGAGEQGILALRQALHIDSHRYTPVGFIDDDPELEGKLVYGYPVFGGHLKLERIVRSKKIDKLLISDHKLHPKIIRRIHNISKQYGLQIQLVKIQLKNLDLYPADADPQNENISFVN